MQLSLRTNAVHCRNTYSNDNNDNTCIEYFIFSRGEYNHVYVINIKHACRNNEKPMKCVMSAHICMFNMSCHILCNLSDIHIFYKENCNGNNNLDGNLTQ